MWKTQIPPYFTTGTTIASFVFFATGVETGWTWFSPHERRTCPIKRDGSYYILSIYVSMSISGVEA
jgi:hypothetical protein